jgi:hypothetical protein
LITIVDVYRGLTSSTPPQLSVYIQILQEFDKLGTMAGETLSLPEELLWHFVIVREICGDARPDLQFPPRPPVRRRPISSDTSHFVDDLVPVLDH